MDFMGLIDNMKTHELERKVIRQSATKEEECCFQVYINSL